MWPQVPRYSTPAVSFISQPGEGEDADDDDDDDVPASNYVFNHAVGK